MYLFVVLVLALIAPASADAAGGWARPVPGVVTGDFRVGPDPFARGQRRGVDLAAVRGEAVRAPCSGRVAYAGAIPTRRLGVSLRCGRLTATVLGLRGLRVARGGLVMRGQRLGEAAGELAVRLGARITARPRGYIDPLALLGAAPHSPALLPLRGPWGVGGDRGRPRQATPPFKVPVGLGRAVNVAPVSAAPPPTGTPLIALIGLVVAGLGLPGLAVSRRGRSGPPAKAKELAPGQ